MKILWDHQAFSYQKYGGVSRMFSEIYKRISTRNEVLIPQFYGHNTYMKDQPFQKSDLLPDFKGKIKVKKLINHKNSIRTIKKGDFDVFHPTDYDDYFLPYLKKPFVLTIHDCIHEENISLLPKSEIKTLEKKQNLIQKSNKIICVSNTTKNKLLTHYPGLDRANISVIYHGKEHLSIPKTTSEKINNPYLLYVGNRSFYKNFQKLIAAFSITRSTNPNLRMYCIGGGVFTPSEKKIIQSYRLKSYVLQMPGAEDTLSQYYQNAEAFIFPSIAEGFGLPILEAFSNNCPVICSDIEIFKEVAGEACVHFNPFDEKNIAQKISEVLNNSSQKSKLISDGKKRLDMFSWEASAISYEELYLSLI